MARRKRNKFAGVDDIYLTKKVLQLDIFHLGLIDNEDTR